VSSVLRPSNDTYPCLGVHATTPRRTTIARLAPSSIPTPATATSSSGLLLLLLLASHGCTGRCCRMPILMYIVFQVFACEIVADASCSTRLTLRLVLAMRPGIPSRTQLWPRDRQQRPLTTPRTCCRRHRWRCVGDWEAQIVGLVITPKCLNSTNDDGFVYLYYRLDTAIGIYS
jgi:hypothetical protein